MKDQIVRPSGFDSGPNLGVETGGSKRNHLPPAR